MRFGCDLTKRFTFAALTAHGVTIDAEGIGNARDRQRMVNCRVDYKLLGKSL